MAKFIKYLIVFLALVFAVSGCFFVFKDREEALAPQEEIIVTEVPEKVSVEKDETEKLIVGKEVPVPDVLPDEISIEVPFTVQAPFAKWDAYHQEACEEASLIMLKYYFDGKKLTPETAEKEIQAMIAYQLKKHGDYRDSDAEGMVELFEGFYGKPKNGKKLKVIYDFSQNDLKKYLSKGEPIVVPAAGRLLGNPYFTQPGPLYHALVLVGYDGNTIITNDPGTKRGEGYRYDIKTLYNAIHDFPGSLDKMEEGRKAMIVVE